LTQKQSERKSSKQQNLNVDIRNPYTFQCKVLNQIPHAKQKEMLLSPAKHKTARCGRRSGKSQMIGGELIRGSWFKLYPRQIVITPFYRQGIIVWEKIYELLYKANVPLMQMATFVKNPRPRITIGDCLIDFGSADNPKSLRGDAYDRIFLDEADFLKTDSMHAIKPLGFDTGAPIWRTSTAWLNGDFDEKYERGMRGEEGYASFTFNYKDNPYLHEDGVKDIELDIEEYGINHRYVQVEILGNKVEGVDSYFKRELIQKCMEDYDLIDLNTFSPFRKNIYVLGVDVARKGEDSSVFIVIEKSHLGEGLKVIYLQETKQRELTDTIGRIIYLHEKFNFNAIYIDETGVGGGVYDVVKEKIKRTNVEGVIFTTQSKMDMYSNLEVHMNRGLLTLPNHKKLLYQLMDLRYEFIGGTSQAGQMKIHHSEKGYDDYPDALAIACMHFQTKRKRMPFGVK